MAAWSLRGRRPTTSWWPSPTRCSSTSATTASRWTSSKAAAKLTLLAGTEKTEVELKPAGDKLEAKGSFKVAAGTKAVAVVTNAGKTLGTARFTLK